MGSQPDIPQTVSIYCPTCGTLLHPDVGERAQKVRCPDCYVAVRVPALAEVLEQQARDRPRPLESVGTYRIQADTAEDAEPAEKTVVPYVEVICRICNSRLHPEVRERAYEVRCPDCHEPVHVPALKDVPEKPRRKRRRQKTGTYGMDAAIVPPKPQTGYLEVQAEIRREAIEEAPRWTFFSGTFSFPWRPGALPRWGLLSLGFTALGMLAVFVTMLIAGGSRFGVSGAAFIGLPAVWIFLWTCSYAAACCLPVVTDTSAGMDRIANWPEPVWNEWMGQLIYVGYIVGEALAVGYGLGLAAGLLGGSAWMVWAAAWFLLFPIFLLSALEADSVFVPLSRPILWTLVSCWWGWLMFYGMSGILVCGWVGLAVAGWMWSPVLVALMLGPMASAVLMISARLLGRLAWRSSLLVVVDDDDGETP